MNRRGIALFLAVAMTLSLCVVSVLAAGQTEETPVASETQGIAETAAPDTAPAPESPEGSAEAAEPAASGETQSSPVGTLSFDNLERRLREGNCNLLALDETIASIEALDYDEMYDDLRDSLNDIADAQWMLIQFGMSDSYTAGTLKQSYQSLRDTFDSLKDGELQQDNADIVLQLRNAQDQIVKAAESLYVALLEMDINRGTLDRSLTALDRSIQEMELRYELGQISALTLDQVKAGRPSLLSSQATLDMNITNYNMQLELMIGADLTGKMVLQPLPEVPQARLDAMDLEADLTAAREASYDLYAAQKTLEDAEENYKDTAKDYHYDTSKYQLVSAQHTLQAAQHTYNATIQNFEMNFRTLYMQVKDYQQILSASRAALSSQEATYASLQLKYEQGNLSQNSLLDAADQVSAAQESVEKAELDLFSAYNSYCWAVEHGILN